MSIARTIVDLRVVTLDAPPPEERFVLVVPGQQAPLYTFDLPNGVTRQARRRIAIQQLADRIGGAPDTLDLIPYGKDEHWTRAIVCDAASRAVWSARAAARSGNCRAVLPDYLALPAAQGHVRLRQSGDAVQVRIGLVDGFSAPVEVAAPMLETALRSAVVGSVSLEGDVSPEIGAVVARAGLVTAAAPVEAFANGELASDLRQGGSAPAAGVRTTLGIWLLAAVLALLAFSIWAGSLALETRAIRADTAALRTETTAILRSGLIPDGPILDIRQQVARALAGAGAGEAPARSQTPLSLISEATVALFGRGITVETLTFAPDDGLGMRIFAPNFAEIDALVADMREAGLDAATENLRARDNGGVTARIDITPSPEALP